MIAIAFFEDLSICPNGGFPQTIRCSVHTRLHISLGLPSFIIALPLVGEVSGTM